MSSNAAYALKRSELADQRNEEILDKISLVIANWLIFLSFCALPARSTLVDKQP
jgi:hypothetical protein